MVEKNSRPDWSAHQFKFSSFGDLRSEKLPWRNPYAPHHILFFGTSRSGLQRKSNRWYDSRSMHRCYSRNNWHAGPGSPNWHSPLFSLNLPPPLSRGFIGFLRFTNSFPDGHSAPPTPWRAGNMHWWSATRNLRVRTDREGEATAVNLFEVACSTWGTFPTCPSPC